MADKKKQNRFNKQAGLFDSPVVNPANANNSLEKKPTKKWDEVMTKRFIAIQEIRKEIKYFSSDFENWARDNFGLDSDEFTEATRLSKKLAKTEALLYNITNMMTELSRTGGLSSNTLKAFDQTFVKLAAASGWETEAAITIKANCLPGCTCGPDAKCPNDHKCDTCKSCQRARLEKKDESQTDHPQEVAHKEASSCGACGQSTDHLEAEAFEGDQETMDMAMGGHVECNCEPDDTCPESRNCRYCPKCQGEIIAAAEPLKNYDMDYTITHDDEDVSWAAIIRGNGFATLEDAEQNLLDVLGDAISKMDLETEDTLEEESDELSKEELDVLDNEDPDQEQEKNKDNPFEKKDDKEEKEASYNDHSQENAYTPLHDDANKIRQAQRTMSEGSPRGTWIEIKLPNSKKVKTLESAFEERGIFAQPVSKNQDHFLRIHNSTKNIDQIITEILQAHNIKATWNSPTE